MASLNRQVVVNISLFTAAIKQAAFDGVMIADYFVITGWDERIREYADLDGMEDDGFDTGDGAFLAASQMMAQNPQLESFFIGRRAEDPLRKIELTPVASSSRIYKVWVNGTAVSYTSDSSATVAEITAGLVSAINTAALGVTATDNTTKLTCLATVLGTFFTVDVDDVDLLKSQETHVLSDAAAELDAIAGENNEWYGFCLTTAGKAEISNSSTGAAKWAETNKKLFIQATADHDCIENGSSDVMSVCQDANYDRTALIFSNRSADFAGAAWMAKTFVNDPGSITFKFKQLASVNAVDLSETQLGYIVDKNGNYFSSFGGVAITGEGITAGGEYIDVTRDTDWFRARLQARVYSVLVNNPKVPYTDAGIALIQTALTAMVQEGIQAGFIDGEQPITYSTPAVADIDSSDRATRILNGMGMSAKLAGAIHKTVLSVNLSA